MVQGHTHMNGTNAQTKKTTKKRLNHSQNWYTVFVFVRRVKLWHSIQPIAVYPITSNIINKCKTCYIGWEYQRTALYKNGMQSGTAESVAVSRSEYYKLCRGNRCLMILSTPWIRTILVLSPPQKQRKTNITRFDDREPLLSKQML